MRGIISKLLRLKLPSRLLDAAHYPVDETFATTKKKTPDFRSPTPSSGLRSAYVFNTSAQWDRLHWTRR